MRTVGFWAIFVAFLLVLVAQTSLAEGVRRTVEQHHARVGLVNAAARGTTFGAAIGGRPSGTWGEAGLYSLDKGKNITAIEGDLLWSAGS